MPAQLPEGAVEDNACPCEPHADHANQVGKVLFEVDAPTGGVLLGQAEVDNHVRQRAYTHDDDPDEGQEWDGRELPQRPAACLYD